MRAVSSGFLVFVLVITACSRSGEAGQAAAASESDSADEIPALDTRIHVDKAPIPPRYSSPLPASLADMRRWVQGDPRFPALGHVKDHVLNGDERWIARLGEAASKVPAADQAEWAKAWTNIVHFETATPGYCVSVRSIVAGPPSAQRAALIGPYAQSCASDAELELIVRADTPDAAVIEYYSAFENEFSSRKHPYHPRFASAARAMILAGDYEARGAAFNLAEHPDPRARAALRTIHAQIADRKRADEIALAFHESKDPADKALTLEACKRMKDDPVCTHPVSAAEVQEPEPPPDPAELEATKSLIAKLSAAGFCKVSALDPANAGGADTRGLLMMAGHAWWFDVETGMFPNYHDSLMRHLAALVSPALDGAVFEETAPNIDSQSAPYRLTMYVAGRRLRAEARNLGDWYDVEAVLNLMNAAMKEIGSDIRFVPLATGDQTLIIVGAPKPVLDRAIAAGLIKPGDANESERAGKEFEAEVLENYQN